MENREQWSSFQGRLWKEEVNVRDFIQNNYTPYDGNESFLEGTTEATDKLWGKLQELFKEARAKGGVLDMDTEIVSSITSHKPGYIDESLKDEEKIVGLQTDKPLKRAFMPFGGIKMAEQSCTTYGYEPDPELHKIFTDYHKTHSDAVFDVYTPEIKKARHNKILTGLPDTYGRGRIVGDYRRVALYGIDILIEEKIKDLNNCGCGVMTDDIIRQREEIAEQVKSLKAMKVMAESYGFDISQPAKNAKEAVQWLYFGYLAAIKTQNGAAMSVGRVSTFLSPVTRYGLLLKLLVLVQTDVLWLQRAITVSSILLKIWDQLLNRTSLFFTARDYRIISETTLLIFQSLHLQFSMKTMMLCVRYGATITASAAVYQLLRLVRKCSSSVQELTLQSVSYTL